jgi:uncharacterized protein (TIGR02569 family)
VATHPIPATAVPPTDVLDLFAVPEDPRPLQGGQGHSFVAGDLVLSPGRDAATCAWLNPVLARLAVELDTTKPRALRIAMPIPSRDGRWVVDGWGASRYEPDTHPCRDLGVLVATGRLLHARLASAQPSPPDGIRDRTDRWAHAERAAFDATTAHGADLEAPGGRGTPLAYAGPLVADLVRQLDDADLGPDQLVHADLAGNVLLDAHGTPVVIDVAPYWRPALWAEAVCILDAVLWHGADADVMAHWADGARRQAILRAALFRLLSDDPSDPTLSRYRTLLLDPPGTCGHGQVTTGL